MKHNCDFKNENHPLHYKKNIFRSMKSENVPFTFSWQWHIISVEILGPPCHSVVMRKEEEQILLFLNSRLTNSLRGRFQCRWFCDPGTVDRTVKNYTGPDTSVTHQWDPFHLSYVKRALYRSLKVTATKKTTYLIPRKRKKCKKKIK